MPPQLIFGTATFGMSPALKKTEGVQALLQTLKTLNIKHLDTAARYPPINPRRSEELIGEVKDLSEGLVVDTKCPTQRRKEVETWRRIRSATSNEQIAKGRCETWGVSNFTLSTMERLFQICDEKGLQKPKYYQGAYNTITRAMESKLLPILRAHGVAFIGYVPLSAGFLTGNLNRNITAGTRFDPCTPIGKALGPRFDSPILVTAMKRFEAAVKEEGLTPTEVSLRWLMHHSVLGENDGVIIGASRVEQIVDSVRLIREGKLSDDVVGLVEELWKAAERAHVS